MGEGFTRAPSEVTVYLRAPGVATDQDSAVYEDVGVSSAESRDGLTVKLEKKMGTFSLKWPFKCSPSSGARGSHSGPLHSTAPQWSSLLTGYRFRLEIRVTIEVLAI